MHRAPPCAPLVPAQQASRSVPTFPGECPAQHCCHNENQTAPRSQVTECIRRCTTRCAAAPAHLEDAHVSKVLASPTEKNLFNFMKPNLLKSASLHFYLHEAPINLCKQLCLKHFEKMLPYNFSGKISISRAQSFVSKGLQQHLTQDRNPSIDLLFLLFLYSNPSLLINCLLYKPAGQHCFQDQLSPASHPVCPPSASQGCINRDTHFLVVKCHTELYFNCQCGYRFLEFFHF